jgi:hypothetical protein
MQCIFNALMVMLLEGEQQHAVPVTVLVCCLSRKAHGSVTYVGFTALCVDSVY